VDTPILSDDAEHAPQPASSRIANAIGILASLIALSGSIYGLAHRHHSRPPVAAPAVVRGTPGGVIYGDPVSPAALARGSRDAAPGRKVCTNEYRWEPSSGAWRCAEWQLLDASQIGRVAYDSGEPCTHRTDLLNESEWTCVTSIPVPTIARTASRSHPVEFGDPLPGGRLCREESRSTGAGPWQCVDSFRPDTHARAVKPVEPRPGCRVYRTADELTGIWQCDDA
jgi:hypothetical protein